MLSSCLTRSPKWLWGLVFLESFVFPLPPDPFYISCLLAAPSRIWRLAFQCTVFSVAGGMVGYGTGLFLTATVAKPFLKACACPSLFEAFQTAVQRWGGWLILAKGFTPVPYKVICVMAGIAQLPLLTFIGTSFLARAIRFYGLALLTRRYGHHVMPLLKKYRGLWLSLGIGLFVMGLFGMGLLVYRTFWPRPLIPS